MNITTKRHAPSAFARLAAVVAAAATMLAGAVAAAPALAADQDEPTNLALASGADAPEVSVSYSGASWSPSTAINNGDLVDTGATGGWGTWGNRSAQESATYTWNRPITTSKSVGYYYTNVPPAVPTGDSGIHLPKDVTLQYLNADTGKYETVPNLKVDKAFPADSELTENQAVYGPFTYTFDEVTTTSMRMVLTKVNNDSLGITVTEWQVFGTIAPLPVDPGDPDQYLWTQEVDLRTTPGKDPSGDLPSHVWATPENGPTIKVPVSWQSIPADAYAAAGSATVEGTAKGGTYDGVTVKDAPVTATVWTVDSLDSEITDVEYVSTITAKGVKPVFPDTVYVEYADGTRQSGHKVTWDEPAAGDYDEVDDFGMVDGAVDGTDIPASATWFVVEPTPSDAKPVVSIDFDPEALNATGWYTGVPKFTVTAQRGVSSSPIETLEYRIAGGEWKAYNGPVSVTEQGEGVTVEARATDDGGRTATVSQTIKVDTNAPGTEEKVEVNGKIATVTLNETDGEKGSGVTRTVYSNGPSSNPNSNENTMWATYEGPVEIALSATADTWLHFYSQDLAGNTQKTVSVNLGKAQLTPATGVAISGDGVADGKLSLRQGKKATLTAAVTPENSTDDVVWSSSDDKVVTVATGKSDAKTAVVTAAGTGTATVTATAGDQKATVEVTVTAADVVDKTELQKAYDGAAALDGDAYTAESWQKLQDALKAAKDVLADGSATQATIDAALRAIDDAVEGLEFRTDATDKDALKAAVAKAKALDRSLYTASSLKAVDAAVKTAEAVLANDAATQDDVKAALSALTDALNGLTRVSSPAPAPGPESGAKPDSEAPTLSATGASVTAVVVAMALLALAGAAALVRRRA